MSQRGKPPTATRLTKRLETPGKRSPSQVRLKGKRRKTRQGTKNSATKIKRQSKLGESVCNLISFPEHMVHLTVPILCTSFWISLTRLLYGCKAEHPSLTKRTTTRESDSMIKFATPRILLVLSPICTACNSASVMVVIDDFFGQINVS